MKLTILFSLSNFIAWRASEAAMSSLFIDDAWFQGPGSRFQVSGFKVWVQGSEKAGQNIRGRKDGIKTCKSVLLNSFLYLMCWSRAASGTVHCLKRTR